MTRDEAIENLQRLQNLLSNDPYIDTQTIITTCNVAIEALKKEPCEDAIIRKSEVELYREKVAEAFERGVLYGKHLAPVQPSRPTGHWIDTGWKCQTDEDEILYGYGCSECGGISFFRKSCNEILGGKWCHCCGAKMAGTQESEEQA